VDVFQAVCRNSNEYTVESHTNIRRIIATRLVESKQNVPHFYLNIECILDKLLDVRNDINEAADLKYKISVNDMIIKAVSLALRDIPQANASWDDSGMIFYNNVDVCVAVAIEGGLITPVIRNSDQKSLLDLSSEMKILVQKAKENKLRPEEFQGGGFTISNLGMYGIRRFSAIINPPQSCIMAVGEGVKRAVVEDNQIKVKTVMDITLSCDHRVVDGAVGAKFLAVFKEYIEKPVKMLL
jgi:pyruvate dehydrogenase E2 component (dihydrolipoamide acetyltransferase)